MSTPSIPASEIVDVLPGVVSAGGTGLDLSGLILTINTRIPLGTALTFTSAPDVLTYFGAGIEADMATVYFQGFDGSDVKPGQLTFFRYYSAAQAAFIRSGPGLTLAAVKAIVSGTLAIVSNGVTKTSSALDLSGAASFSAAATLITAAFTTPGFVVTYDSISGCFVVTSSSTGATSTLSVVAGTNATALKLTAATGAISSPGAAVPASAYAVMSTVTPQTQDWATFTTAFEASDTEATDLAHWASDSLNRYGYVNWSTDVLNATAGDTSIPAFLIDAAGYDGTLCLYSPLNGALMGAFVISFAASLDFSATNGRADLCNRHPIGLVADVTDSVTAAGLNANGVNFYGAWGTANDRFLFFRRGTIFGEYAFFDSYVNQIWLNNNLQLAGMTLLDQVKSIPYTATGDGLITMGLQDPIDQAVNFGAIRAGVTLSSVQKVTVNNSAGTKISDILETRGWYLQIISATPTERAARAKRKVKFWYTDGQSVQGLDISSLEVQ